MEPTQDPRPRRYGLSKSKIAAFEQCPKRLWLQVHQPERAELDPSRELRFQAGHELGALACELVPNGVMIEAEPDMTAAIERTRELIEASDRQPLFEATFVHDGVLVRLDIMEPKEDGSWHVAEVKSSTSRKECYVPDLATQLWVVEQNGVRVRSAAIRHVNNQFVLAEDGCFDGLLVDVPSLDDAQEFIRNRAEVVAEARTVLAGPEPQLDIGEHCTSPYECEFGSYCRSCTTLPAWPISLLPNSGAKLAAIWAEDGIIELTDIPTGGLSNPLHERIRKATCDDVAYHDAEGARQAVAQWDWPRSFLDFESIAFVIPRWIGTRPWQQVPFQFSLHIEHENGELEHREFLSLSGEDPRRACAEALVGALPPAGAIVTYSASFERSRVKELAELFPDLKDALLGIADRIVDLLPVTKKHWYHRDQRGSWSIKYVLPTITSEAGYEALEVADGTAAQIAYLEAIRVECTPSRRAQLDGNLRAYCALDTRAMVKLLHHLVSNQGPAGK
jgi:CRISPR/Cas system-associated exonuclease Cas4 (RecB family)